MRLVALRDFDNSVGVIEFGQIFEADARAARDLLASGCAGAPGPELSAVLMASGPSLVAEDIEMVRAWRETTPGAKVFVTNLTFRLAPWADHLYALDGSWWSEYGDEARATFKGQMWTPSPAAAEMFGARLISMKKRSRGLSKNRGVLYGCNSGRHLLDLAYQLGARRMVLLGYDMGESNGRAHWHEPYPPRVQMKPSYVGWAREFEEVSRDLQKLGVVVVNASRKTALSCFRIKRLDETFVVGRS